MSVECPIPLGVGQTEVLSIRAHHTSIVHAVLVEGITAARYFEEAEANAQVLTQTALTDRARQTYPDRYGDGEGGLFNVRGASFVNSVLRAPSDYAVKVDATPDAICGGCVIGNHCLENMRDDRRFLEAIGKIASGLQLEDHIVAAKETIIWRDGSERTGTAVYMPAGVARNIFGHRDYDYAASTPYRRMMRSIEAMVRKWEPAAYVPRGRAKTP